MPKDVVLRPNLRVDIPDLDDKTSGYSRENNKLLWERFLMDNRATVADGFRVEIADQGSSPGLFTVVNGTASDRDGQMVNNEEDYAAARSETLSVDSTYFVEIEFIETESDSDARSLWDQSYNNGLDPSGDQRASGREFSRAIATRNTPDWKIVSPISTSGFELTTNANSLRIPIAVLTVSSSAIAGGTKDTLQTVLAESISIGSTTLKLFDTRAMPDTFTGSLEWEDNVEAVSVTANDRENGVLTLGGGTTFAHSVGVLFEMQTPLPQYLIERTGTSIPSSGTEDARPRYFQGDEVRGAALSKDPHVAQQSGDQQVSTLKRYIDFLAGQIAELKYGSALDPGNTAPPTAFPAAPRYFSNAGSIAGARTNTVSVGDGVSTFGDFNSLQSGSAQAALQAAIDAVVDGGIVYIKRGSYSISTAITVDKSVRIVGDIKETNIDATGANAVLAITTAATNVTLEELDLSVSGTALSSVTIASGAATELKVYRCDLDGLEIRSNTTVLDSNIEVTPSGTITVGPAAGVAKLDSVSFRNCHITNNGTGASYRCMSLPKSEGLTIDGCFFEPATSSDFMVEFTALSNSNISIRNCQTDTGAPAPTTAQYGFPGNAFEHSNIVFEAVSFNASDLTNLDGVTNSTGITVVGTVDVRNEVKTSELQLREDPSNGVDRISIQAPTLLSSTYAYTLPGTLPASDSLMQVDNIGTVTHSRDLDVDTITTAERGIRHAAVRRVIPFQITGTPDSGDLQGGWDVASDGVVGDVYLRSNAGGNSYYANIPVSDGERLLEVRATIYNNVGVVTSMDVVSRRTNNILIADPPNESPPGTLLSLGSTSNSVANVDFRWLIISTSTILDPDNFIYTIEIKSFGADVRLYNLTYVVERVI